MQDRPIRRGRRRSSGKDFQIAAVAGVKHHRSLVSFALSDLWAEAEDFGVEVHRTVEIGNPNRYMVESSTAENAVCSCHTCPILVRVARHARIMVMGNWESVALGVQGPGEGSGVCHSRGINGFERGNCGFRVVRLWAFV